MSLGKRHVRAAYGTAAALPPLRYTSPIYKTLGASATLNGVPSRHPEQRAPFSTLASGDDEVFQQSAGIVEDVAAAELPKVHSARGEPEGRRESRMKCVAEVAAERDQLRAELVGLRVHLQSEEEAVVSMEQHLQSSEKVLAGERHERQSAQASEASLRTELLQQSAALQATERMQDSVLEVHLQDAEISRLKQELELLESEAKLSYNEASHLAPLVHLAEGKGPEPEAASKEVRSISVQTEPTAQQQVQVQEENSFEASQLALLRKQLPVMEARVAALRQEHQEALTAEHADAIAHLDGGKSSEHSEALELALRHEEAQREELEKRMAALLQHVKLICKLASERQNLFSHAEALVDDVQDAAGRPRLERHRGQDMPPSPEARKELPKRRHEASQLKPRAIGLKSELVRKRRQFVAEQEAAAATVIQKHCRGYVARRHTALQKVAALVVAAGQKESLPEHM
mmetsp:Transcript_25771/g.47101  ORF Transcript_25771/g.47101 Transcript_25771/m.47101 type:complete len:461 (+) Transcript_25771:52-1434(+)